jgi:hypothetical protein
VNEVEAPGAKVDVPKPEVTVKPAGTVIGPVSTRFDTPTFWIVNVFVTGVPTNVVEKLTLPVLLGILVEPSNT